MLIFYVKAQGKIINVTNTIILYFHYFSCIILNENNIIAISLYHFTGEDDFYIFKSMNNILLYYNILQIIYYYVLFIQYYIYRSGLSFLINKLQFTYFKIFSLLNKNLNIHRKKYIFIYLKYLIFILYVSFMEPSSESIHIKNTEYIQMCLMFIFQSATPVHTPMNIYLLV